MFLVTLFSVKNREYVHIHVCTLLTEEDARTLNHEAEFWLWLLCVCACTDAAFYITGCCQSVCMLCDASPEYTVHRTTHKN